MGELSDRELASVLDRAGLGGSVEPDRRLQIRADVLREFDRSVIAAETGDAVPIVLTPTSAPRPVMPRRPWAILAAAATVGVVVGGLVIAGSRASVEQPPADQPLATATTAVPRSTNFAPTESVLPLIDELAIGDPIPPGRYQTAVAGGLSFEMTDGATLVGVAGDRLTIGLGDVEATVSIVAIENVSSLDVAIERAEALGLLRVERSAGRLGDRPTLRRDITLTAEAIERYGCVAGEPCDVLPTIAPGSSPLALRSGAENYTTLVEVANGADVAIVEQFETFGPPISTIANSIIATIEVVHPD